MRIKVVVELRVNEVRDDMQLWIDSDWGGSQPTRTLAMDNGDIADPGRASPRCLPSLLRVLDERRALVAERYPLYRDQGHGLPRETGRSSQRVRTK